MRPKRAAAAGGALALLVVLGACSENTARAPRWQRHRPGSRPVSIATDPKDSQGPAAEVAGAHEGRHLHASSGRPRSRTWTRSGSYSFAGLMERPLYARYLTTWKDDGKGKV